MTTTIVTATDIDSDRLLAAAVLAFSTDPFVRWAAADLHQYLTHYPAVV